MAVIYLPIDSAEMRDHAAEWNADRVTKGKAAYRVIRCTQTGFAKNVRRVGFGALRNVGANEKIYVLTHGIHRVNEAGARRVGARRVPGGPLRMYRPAELAEHLQAEGLTHQIRDLRLFSCGAGLAVDEGPAFGAQLFDALRGLGYGVVVVSAYLGNLRVGQGHRAMPVHDDDDEAPYVASEDNANFTASTHKGVDIVGPMGGTTGFPAKYGRVRYL